MEATAAVPSRARVLQAFRSRNFRLLWTGQAISLLGDAAFVVALGWRTFTLTGSARSLGLVLTFQGVGVLTTVLVGGALADRYDRRTLMLVSDLARFAVIGGLAVARRERAPDDPLARRDRLRRRPRDRLLHAGARRPDPARGRGRPARLRECADRDRAPGELPGRPGRRVAALRPRRARPFVFGFNACSYLVSFAFVYATRPREAEKAAEDGTLRAIREGFRYIAGVPWLWITICLFAFVLMLQWASIQVLTPKLVREHFDLGVGAYGLLFSLIGGGMIVGTFIFGQLNPRRRRGLISYLIWIVNSLLVIVFALSPWFPLAAAAAFVRGICIGFGVTVWETMLMELVPRHMLSRVVSLDWFGSLGLTPFGLLFVGAISDLAAPGTIIALAAAISICIISLGLTSKQIRTID